MAETPKDVFLNDLLFDGSDGLKVQVAETITGATLTRTTEGVSTLEIELTDKGHKLLESNIVNSRITAQVSGRSFSAVAFRKTDYDAMSWTFEDLAVAAMRTRDEPRKFAAGSVTRAQAAQTLLDEIGWVPLAVGGSDPQQVKIELARGILSSAPKDAEPTATTDVEDDGSSYYLAGAAPKGDGSSAAETEVTQENREDTWTAIKRWFAEVNWNCYVDDGKLNVGPQSSYIAGDPVFRVTDGLPSMTSAVTYDWDIGKPLATASYSVMTDSFAAAPGTCVELYELGPANGKWFISESTRNLFSTVTQITLQKPEPDLSEPEAPVTAASALASIYGDYAPDPTFNQSDGETGAGSGAWTAAKWKWPVDGSHKINSGFSLARVNPVSGKVAPHKGIDIQANEGQAVYASNGGVVSYAGTMEGYGNIVIINHPATTPASGPYLPGQRPVSGASETRYAHLSKITTGRGFIIASKQKIGEVGHTGNVTGPHLHFEIRRGQGDKAVPLDPAAVLRGEIQV